MTNPEYKEKTEKYRKQNEYTLEIEEKILDKLSRGIDRYSDIVTCPNRSCGVPVKVDIEEKLITLTCSSCGWTHIVKRIKRV
ncbi:MAG: hypothetical protein Q8P30_01790 [Candidatus Uhrbacteria bacterium]|nr:hypothetical protein [Candidatus Uhrbacteria bacterium]